MSRENDRQARREELLRQMAERSAAIQNGTLNKPKDEKAQAAPAEDAAAAAADEATEAEREPEKHVVSTALVHEDWKQSKPEAAPVRTDEEDAAPKAFVIRTGPAREHVPQDVVEILQRLEERTAAVVDSLDSEPSQEPEPHHEETIDVPSDHQEPELEGRGESVEVSDQVVADKAE
jgi:hypothetical protein